jgi:hypothetical protein
MTDLLLWRNRRLARRRKGRSFPATDHHDFVNPDNGEESKMKQNNIRPLRDHWLWEPPMLRAFVTVATILPLLACGMMLPSIGPKAFYILIFLSFAPGFGLTYGFVGKRIACMRDAIPPEEGVVIPGRIVKGVVEAAGIVVMGKESLIFYPVVGERSETSLSEISSVRESSYFNGSALIGKTGFWFTVPDKSRLACAIPNSYTEQFRAWLSDGMKDDS